MIDFCTPWYFDIKSEGFATCIKVVSKRKGYFRNVLMSCQHTWQCDIQMLNFQVSCNSLTAFHKSGKLCYIKFVALNFKNAFDLRCEIVTFAINGYWSGL